MPGYFIKNDSKGLVSRLQCIRINVLTHHLNLCSKRPYMSLLSIFASSPFRATQEHMDIVYDCVEALDPFFQAVMDENWEEASKCHDKVSSLENDADRIKSRVFSHLPSGIFMPVSRGDLLELIRAQDKIANRAEDLSGLILGRNMVIPKGIVEPIMRFLKSSKLVALQAKKTTNELDELLETGFKGKEAELVKGMIRELDKLETHSDQLQIETRSELFRIEKDLPPIDVMFLYKIIELIGEIADAAQRVGHCFMLLLAR